MSYPRETFVFIANSPELMVLLKTSVVIAAALLIVWTYRSARASIRHLCLTAPMPAFLKHKTKTRRSGPRYSTVLFSKRLRVAS